MRGPPGASLRRRRRRLFLRDERALFLGQRDTFERLGRGGFAELARRRLPREEIHPRPGVTLPALRSIIHRHDVHEEVRRVRQRRALEHQGLEVPHRGGRVTYERQPPVGQEHELIEHGEDRRPRLVDGTHDASAVAGQVPQRGHDVLRLKGVQAGRGFVEEDRRGVADHLHADVAPFAFAPRQPSSEAARGPHGRVSHVLQPQLGDEPVDALRLLGVGGRRRETQPRVEHERLVHGEELEQEFFLHDVRHALVEVLGPRGAVDGHFTRQDAPRGDPAAEYV